MCVMKEPIQKIFGYNCRDGVFEVNETEMEVLRFFYRIYNDKRLDRIIFNFAHLPIVVLLPLLGDPDSYNMEGLPPADNPAYSFQKDRQYKKCLQLLQEYEKTNPKQKESAVYSFGLLQDDNLMITTPKAKRNELTEQISALILQAREDNLILAVDVLENIKKQLDAKQIIASEPIISKEEWERVRSALQQKHMNEE